MKYIAQYLTVLVLAPILGSSQLWANVAQQTVRSSPDYQSTADVDLTRSFSQDSSITLASALNRTLEKNPILRSISGEVIAGQARVLQAGLRPNPEFGLEIENFAGGDELRGFESSEVTLSLSQLVELGGDRRNRYRVAEHERDLAQWNYESIKLDLLRQTTRAYYAVLAWQERVRFSDTLRFRAEEFYNTVLARVNAGKVSALEEKRARVILASARLESFRASNEVRRSRSRLSSSWGDSIENPIFTLVQGSLYSIKDVPSFDDVSELLIQNPDYARFSDEIGLQQAGLDLAKAARIPDPVLGIGIRRLGELDVNGFTAGFSIPIPLFDRNQGDVREATAKIGKAEDEKRAAFVRLHFELGDAHQRLSLAHEEVKLVREDLLPAARESYLAMQEGYLEGKFDLLTVLDTHRAFFEATKRYIDALENYHFNRADVDRLTATPHLEF